MQPEWFALHTHHQHEDKVRLILESKGFGTFLPMYQTTKQWSDRRKIVRVPLFPGYLFVSQIADRRLEVLDTRGVADIVNTCGVPSPISEGEIETIRRAVSDIEKVEPHPYLRVGDEVRVHSGPLAGLSGFLIRKKDCYRIVVCVDILGRAASVEIDASDLDSSRILISRGESHVS